MSKKTEKDVIGLFLLKKQAEELGGQISALQERIVGDFVSSDTKSISVEHEGVTIKATFVQGTTLVYDEKGLEKKLGKALWAKTLKSVFDKKKLEALITTGVVNVDVVAQFAEEKQSSPYIKLTA